MGSTLTQKLTRVWARDVGHEGVRSLRARVRYMNAIIWTGVGSFATAFPLAFVLSDSAYGIVSKVLVLPLFVPVAGVVVEVRRGKRAAARFVGLPLCEARHLDTWTRERFRASLAKTRERLAAA